MQVAYFGIKRHPESLKNLILEKLQELNCEITNCLYEDSLDSQIKAVEKADAVLLAPARHIRKEVLESMKKVKLLQIWSSGFDKFNLLEAKNLGLKVANNGGHNSIAVAEQTLLLLLAIYKNLNDGQQRVKSGIWEGNSHGMDNYTLQGKTIGIYGLGNIGSKVAKLCLAFGMDVIYHDIERKKDFEENNKIKYVSKNQLLSNSDVISLHLHLNNHTKAILGEDEISIMKDKVVIINVSRADLIDRSALELNLFNGKIHALGLDVYYEEPNNYQDPIINHKNFVGTPHSSCTIDTHISALNACIKNIRAALNGLEIDYLI